MIPHPFESRYLEKLRQALIKELERLHQNLGNGASIRETAADTGMVTTGMVREIQGVKTALKLMQEVHDDLSGRNPPKEKN